jgi:hypothetical protein
MRGGYLTHGLLFVSTVKIAEPSPMHALHETLDKSLPPSFYFSARLVAVVSV